MTASDWNKIAKTLRSKPVVLKKFIRHNKPHERKYGLSVRKCRRCGRFGAHLNQYNLHLCRQCFREIAEEVGFKKYS